MKRHDAHFVRALISLPLHVRGAASKGNEELGQAQKPARAKRLGKIQQLIKRVEAFRTKPCREGLSASFSFEDMREKVERAQMMRELPPIGEPCCRNGIFVVTVSGGSLQLLPERSPPPGRRSVQKGRRRRSRTGGFSELPQAPGHRPVEAEHLRATSDP